MNSKAVRNRGRKLFCQRTEAPSLLRALEPLSERYPRALLLWGFPPLGFQPRTNQYTAATINITTMCLPMYEKFWSTNSEASLPSVLKRASITIMSSWATPKISPTKAWNEMIPSKSRKVIKVSTLPVRPSGPLILVHDVMVRMDKVPRKPTLPAWIKFSQPMTPYMVTMVMNPADLIKNSIYSP